MARRHREGGQDVRKERADPVRSAASLLDLQSRVKEDAVQHRRKCSKIKDRGDTQTQE